MIRHPEPPARSLPLRVAIILLGSSIVLAAIGVGLISWASAAARNNLAKGFEAKIRALEAQVTAMCATATDPATCRPVTQQPVIMVVPATTTTVARTVPFPPATLAPANPPGSAPPSPSPAPESTTTTTRAPAAPTTTVPTTAPCTTIPVVGSCLTKASRGSRRVQLDWEALRQCENGGRYTSDPADFYRGAYQADRGTWNGLWERHNRPDLVDLDPAEASPDDQDAFAHILYAERGAQPWPNCGRYL